MKTLQPVLLIYTLLIFAGGIFGFIFKGSIASLVMSSMFSLALTLNLFYAKRNPKRSFIISAFLTAALTAFFSMRFLITYAFMPAGMMLIISSAVIACHIYVRKNITALVLKP